MCDLYIAEGAHDCPSCDRGDLAEILAATWALCVAALAEESDATPEDTAERAAYTRVLAVLEETTPTPEETPMRDTQPDAPQPQCAPGDRVLVPGEVARITPAGLPAVSFAQHHGGRDDGDLVVRAADVHPVPPTPDPRDTAHAAAIISEHRIAWDDPGLPATCWANGCRWQYAITDVNHADEEHAAHVVELLRAAGHLAAPPATAPDSTTMASAAAAAVLDDTGLVGEPLPPGTRLRVHSSAPNGDGITIVLDLDRRSPIPGPVPAPPASTPTGWTAKRHGPHVVVFDADGRKVATVFDSLLTDGDLEDRVQSGNVAAAILARRQRKADAATIATAHDIPVGLLEDEDGAPYPDEVQRAHESAVLDYAADALDGVAPVPAPPAPTPSGWTAERAGGRIVANHPDGRRISRNDSVPDEDLLHEMAENDQAWEPGFQAIFAVRAEEAAAAAPATTDDDRILAAARALVGFEPSEYTHADLRTRWRLKAARRAVLAADDSARAAGSPEVPGVR